MKTITKLGLAVTLLFLVSFFTQANAQSHDIKARNCKYWKKSPNPGSGAEVTDFSVCKVCSEKKDKEEAAKRAEDKRRHEALVAKTKADNERKAKEAAEKQRLQNEKNKPTNATLVTSSTKENVKKTSITSNSNKTTKERLKVIKGDEDSYKLVDKTNATILTVTNAYLSDFPYYFSGDAVQQEDMLPNVYMISNKLNIGYQANSNSGYQSIDNLINSKGEKLFLERDIISLSYCGNNYFLLIVPVNTSSEIKNGYFGTKYRDSYYKYIVYDAKTKKEYSSEEIFRPRTTGLLPYKKRISERKNQTEIDNVGQENILAILYYKSGYDLYFDLRDKKFKTFNN